MFNASVRNTTETQPFRCWLIVGYVVVISIAVDSALMLGAAIEGSWIGLAVMVLSIALISTGTLFTALEMVKLAGRARRGEGSADYAKARHLRRVGSGNGAA